MKARIDEGVVAKTRAVLARNENDCVRRAMGADDGSFKLLVTASLSTKCSDDEDAFSTPMIDRVSEQSLSRLCTR
jgi:hypothetical protein